MRARAREFNMPQPFTADTGERHFDAALVANHAAMLHALVFAAQAFPIGNRTENPGAEQSIALRLKSPVIDGLGLGHLAVRPAPDLFRRGQRNSNRIEICDQIRPVVGRRTIHMISHVVGVLFLSFSFSLAHQPANPPPAPFPALRAASSSTPRPDTTTATHESVR